MLEEYIRQQLSDLEEDADQLTEQLKKLNEQEKSAEEILNSLTEHEDIGMEIFSPRSNERKKKKKIEEQTDHINELKFQQDQVADKISRNREEEDKWKKLLEEALEKRNKEEEENFNRISRENIRICSKKEITAPDANSSFIINNEDYQNKVRTEENLKEENLKEESNKQTIEEWKNAYIKQLETILERLNQCSKDLYSDRKKCGNEIRNLQYYLKALISSYKKS